MHRFLAAALLTGCCALSAAAQEDVSSRSAAQRTAAQQAFAPRSTASADARITADSLPQTWTYTPENLQAIPGGPSDSWWRQFSDPLLDSLITLGMSNNYDLAAAQHRMQLARAAVVFGMAINAIIGTLFVPNFWELFQRFNERYLSRLFRSADQLPDKKTDSH